MGNPGIGKAKFVSYRGNTKDSQYSNDGTSTLSSTECVDVDIWNCTCPVSVRVYVSITMED